MEDLVGDLAEVTSPKFPGRTEGENHRRAAGIDGVAGCLGRKGEGNGWVCGCVRGCVWWPRGWVGSWVGGKIAPANKDETAGAMSRYPRRFRVFPASGMFRPNMRPRLKLPPAARVLSRRRYATYPWRFWPKPPGVKLGLPITTDHRRKKIQTAGGNVCGYKRFSSSVSGELTL